MELSFEEYRDTDLSLIQDYYETTFAHYEPSVAERIFIVRDAHWLVGAVRLQDEEGFYHLCGFQLLPHYQSLGVGSQLLKHACRGLAGKPVVCQVLPFEKPFYLHAGFADLPLQQLSGPLFSFYDQQCQQGYQIELLILDTPSLTQH
ncbi:GNAT family N-acetyltransferase [Aeromonas cavernicola]|uniref:GNAT family N-acetyltransferase n=1 Tax=Aeromonas cavernicola TaxID=1006623 RepID=A0A2H9U2J8_9GAMM|nr:GNAT family N-acetyltransferase [Aeromonas cavernicola]PJG58272.1 GNAT family N-acetyltransferase [Aeromonas cavernicola]